MPSKALRFAILRLYWYLVSLYLSLVISTAETEDCMEDEELDDRPTHRLIPALRVYIGAITADGDFVDCSDVEMWLGQKGPRATIVELLEDGLGSIFVVDHHNEEKLL